MKTYLHKTPKGFVLTSDEDIKQTGLVLFSNGVSCELLTITDTDEFCGIEEDGGLGTIRLSNCKKVITQQDHIDFGELLLDDQIRVGWFDVEKLADDHIKSCGLKNFMDEDEITIIKLHHTLGFQKAQDLLSDRMFTLVDMREAIAESWNSCEDNEDQETFTQVFYRILKSRTQTSWEVVIETECTYGDDCPSKGDYLKQHLCNVQPKFTDGKIKILKIYE